MGVSPIQKTKYNASVFLNFLLIAVIVGIIFTQKPAEATVESIISTNQTDMLPVAENRDNASSYKQFLALGLSEAQAKALVLHGFHLELKTSVAKYSSEFWCESPHKSQLKYIAATFKNNNKLRTLLVSEFGAEAETDLLFKEIFHPLEMQYPFLSSSEQIALQKLQFEQQQNMFAGAPGQSNTLAHSPADILSTESWREFQLRASPIADRLRQSGVVFNENSFRKTVGLLTGSSDTPNPRTVNLDEQTVRALRDLLGQEAVFKIRLQLEPQFANLVRAGRQHGLSDEDISTAYQVMTEHNSVIADAYQQKQFNGEEGATQLRAALLERREQLVSLFGDEATDALLQPRPKQPQLPFPIPRL